MPEAKIEVKGYLCNSCGHKWIPRVKKQKPFVCPKCKSARWDVEKEK
jgi:predicted Zn-ribbon and HTH transcriptional regulator